MLWTVVYRDAHGGQGRMEMEAENRAVVIGNMRERGLQVVNIMDGGLAANSRRRKSHAERLEASSRGGGVLRWTLLALLLALAAGAAWWYAAGQPDLVAPLVEKVHPKPKPPGKAVIRFSE